ncbi:MAG: ATP-binding protein [Rhodobacteraceae bacterium]|nr:ATP-binding protein [Paracoccaceae bacterium]
MNKTDIFEMSVDLNVLNHLGIKLYSSIPAVISEAVANAWDADASLVRIQVSKSEIAILDDGHGMTVDDINSKFLTVGYQRRKDGHALTPNGRRVLGRKGIGKLSLFSIANTIEVHSKKNGIHSGLLLSLPEIQASIEAGEGTYKPRQTDTDDFPSLTGTRIVIRDIRKATSHAPGPLRRRLARRFSELAQPASGFRVEVNGVEITSEDRQYFKKVEFLWTYGDGGKQVQSLSNAQKIFERDAPFSGWIGTVKSAGDLVSEDGDNLNDVQIMVRGRVAQEKTLQFFGEDGVYASYVVGEIHADWLDDDSQDDIATTNRQSLIEDDDRVRKLHEAIQSELKHIQNVWTSLRNEAGKKEALKVPEVDEWFTTLGGDQRTRASQLFGKINQLRLEPEDKKPLFKYGVLAFEKLKVRDSLSRLESISDDDFSGFLKAFESHDELEAQLYYEISRGRLDIIRSFEGLTEDNRLEKVLQKFLFEHLWLLDPSWDRATKDASMEVEVKKAVLNEEEFDGDYMEEIGRVDVHYRKVGGEHLIIELKRAGVITETDDLFRQVRKYQRKMDQLLANLNRASEAYEIVCLVGQDLRDWKEPMGRQQSFDIMRQARARVMTYQQLIQSARNAYNEYLDASQQAGKIYKILDAIDRSILSD